MVDRMLGKLATWLRIFGYDTLYIGDFDVDDEDTFLLENFQDRILLTRDKELYERSVRRGRKVVFIDSDSVIEQIREMQEFGITAEIRMVRCSVCNTLLRKPTEREAREVMKMEGIEENLMERYELWYCENCRKLYWLGSHYRNMVKFLEGLK
ncbi:Mut7-C RNAse domain-containing protein [Geoglobus acetivorans]|uniref:Mut7-C RNAse domain-containing protein n=1 Tax=Geoglobus acetivorans TaxID=565033 RepID=A0ABZ3H621_GEOAI